MQQFHSYLFHYVEKIMERRNGGLCMACVVTMYPDRSIFDGH